jgi:23S rRNA G2445 N2-methylase RlmL
MPHKREGLVQLREAAAAIGVSPNTLRNWDRSGRLSAKRHPVNRYRLYRLSDIRKLIEKTGGSLMSSSAPRGIVLGEGLAHRAEAHDERSIKRVFNQLGRAFRDSQGGGHLERFEEISKLLFCKLRDEELVRRGHGSVFMTDLAGDETRYLLIANLYAEVVKQHPKVFIGNRAYITKDRPAALQAANILKEINLTAAGDIKGSAYEELVKDTFEKSDNQQYFTPRRIVQFMVDFLDPRPGEAICDPACGSGGFLVAALERLNEQENTGRHKLFGIEIDARMGWIAQMNVLMHGGDPDGILCSSDGGALSKSTFIAQKLKGNSCDLILTNPPFGSDYSDKRELDTYRTGRGHTSRRRGILFMERCIELLRPGGRLGIIIDDTVLNGTANSDIRKLLLEKAHVDAIISLPGVTFMPYASAKASMVFLTKKGAHDSGRHIFMSDIEEVGKRPNGDPLYSEERDGSGRLQLKDDLPSALASWNRFIKIGPRALAGLHPKIFSVPDDEFKKLANETAECRLDLMSHHPARRLAEKALSRSPYPTPRLLELAAVRNISCLPSATHPDELCRFIGLANIEARTGEYDVSEIRGERIMSAVHVFRGGDIIFPRLRPELRKIVIIADNEEEGFVSSECVVLRGTDRLSGEPDLANVKFGAGELDSEYLAFILRSDVIFGQLVYQITGLGRPRITKQGILNLRIPLPPMALQREIASVYRKSRDRYLACLGKGREAMREAKQAVAEAYEVAQHELHVE